VLPAVRYAVDAYVNFARQKPGSRRSRRRSPSCSGRPRSACALAALEAHYPWIDPAGLEYFRDRLEQAPRDAEYALELVVGALPHARAAGRAVAALQFKTEMLWAQLEAIERATRNRRPRREPAPARRRRAPASTTTCARSTCCSSRGACA
jgi:pyrroloquinoline-quinone synthase